MSDVVSQLTFRRFLDTSPRLYTVDIIETNILIQAKQFEMLNVPSGISVKPIHSKKYLKGNKYKVYRILCTFWILVTTFPYFPADRIM